MKKNTLNKILLTLILLLTSYNVKAEMQLITSCKYKDEEGNVFRYNSFQDKTNFYVLPAYNGLVPDTEVDIELNLSLFVTGLIDEKVTFKKVQSADEKGLIGFGEGTGKNRVIYGNCPKYAIEYTNEKLGQGYTYYAATDNLEKLTVEYDSMKVYTYEKIDYNYKDFCFYNYTSKDDNGNQIGTTPLIMNKYDFNKNELYKLNLNEFASINEMDILNNCNSNNKISYCGIGTLRTDVAPAKYVKSLENGCSKYISSPYSYKKNPSFSGRDFMIESQSAKNYFTKIIHHDLEDIFEEPQIKEDAHLICSDIFDKEMLEWINTAMFIIQILAIIIIIILTVKDYAIVILNSDQDNMKKNNKNLIKRIALLIVLLLVPALIKFTFKVFRIEIIDSKDPLCQKIDR